MKEKLLTTFLFILLNNFSFSQVGIGTTNPDPSSILDINSTTGGILIPRMTMAERNAIVSPATGLLIFQIDNTQGFWYYNGTAWTNFSAPTTGWSIIGNSGTTGTNYVGTSDAQDFVFRTNNTERVRIQQTTRNIGINNNNPTNKLHITGTSPAIRVVDGLQAAGYVITSDASGNAYWGDPTGLVFTGTSYDWNFVSGSTFADPISHWGPTVIGRTGTTLHHLDVDNGTTSGSTFGIGDVEIISDGNNEIIFNQNFVPITDNTAALTVGTSTNRWNTIYAANGTIQTSDRNQKKNIQTIPYGLTELLQLRPVSYYWKSEKHNAIEIPNDKKQLKLGLIAQEVQKIIPEVVYTSSYNALNPENETQLTKVENDLLGINYEELLPVLVKAKQEQNSIIKALQERIDELTKNVNSIIKK